MIPNHLREDCPVVALRDNGSVPAEIMKDSRTVAALMMEKYRSAAPGSKRASVIPCSYQPLLTTKATHYPWCACSLVH